MTHISPPGKKYNRSSLLSLENNYGHANAGAKHCNIMGYYKDVTDRIGYRLNRYNLYGIYYTLAVVVHQMRRLAKVLSLSG